MNNVTKIHMAHIATEVVVLGYVLYANKKLHKKLIERIVELEEENTENRLLLKKHEEIIPQLVNAVNMMNMSTGVEKPDKFAKPAKPAKPSKPSKQHSVNSPVKKPIVVIEENFVKEQESISDNESEQSEVSETDLDEEIRNELEELEQK
jgi:hypothetical protein